MNKVETKVNQIQIYNQIAPSSLTIFPEKDYLVSQETTEPDGIILRSYNLHHMDISSNLKAIARAGAGVNNIPIERCTDHGIVVFNTPGANANAVKEAVIASMLLASRHLVEGVQWAKSLAGNEELVPQLVEAGKKQFAGAEISGKKLGVIGLGAIGALVANDALALGMEVIGYDPYISVDTAWRLSKEVQRAMSLEELFAQCDFITVHVPLTDNTKQFLNEEAFSMMKKSVHILNFSRGELVNDLDLEKAIAAGIVARYITDFPNDRVLKMKNVIPIPHLGASTKEAEENCAMMAAKQMKAFLETGNIKNSVNFPAVYLPYDGKTRITVIHENIPNMVGQITTKLAELHVNIADMINRGRNHIAYTMIDVDTEITSYVKEQIKEKIETIQGINTIRIIHK